MLIVVLTVIGALSEIRWLNLLFIYKQLREINLQDLTLHLDIFDEHRENDFEEIQQKLKAIQFEFKWVFTNHFYMCTCTCTCTINIE